MLVAALLFAFQAGVALAGPTAQFDIPAQPLAAALSSVASQAGVQVVFRAEVVGNVRSIALKGAMSVETALERLLAGSGLKFEQEGERNYVVVKTAHSSGETTLSEMVVTATRTERPVDEVPASVSVLTEKNLATKNRQNVYDALRDIEGLDFGSQRGVAHQITPSIRGFSDSAKTTQILVDGMALDSVVSQIMGRGGLNFTSLQDVERIEVVRGPASALYGPSTIAGVINVLPKRWKGAPGVEFNTAYGTHNTRTMGIAAGAANEIFDIRVSAYDAKSDGYVATSKINADGQYDIGGRDWVDKKSGLMLGFRPADDQELTFGYQQYETLSAGYGGRPNDRNNLDGESFTLGYRYDLSADTSFKANFRSTHLKQDYLFDSWDWNGLATPGTVTSSDLALYRSGWRDSTSKFFQFILDTRPMPDNQLIAGYAHDTGEHKTYGSSTGSINASRSKMDGLFVQDEHKFGPLTLTAGIRHDRIDLSPDTLDGTPVNGSGSVANVTNPRIGARYHLTDATSVYASYGTAYVPALNGYKFVQPSTTRIDNPDLKPETSKTMEIGMNNRLSSGTLRTALFHTDYEDKITLGTDAASGMRQWQNVAAVKVDGIEIAYQGDLGHGWLPYANASYTKARDHATPSDSGTQSLRIAPRKFNIGMTYAPGDAWAATLNARYVSGLYFNALNQAEWADAHTQVDAKISTKLPIQGQRLEAFLAVNNMTNSKYEVFNKNEWTEGRSFTIGLNGRF